jgi:hypothetical protein
MLAAGEFDVLGGCAAENRGADFNTAIGYQQ